MSLFKPKNYIGIMSGTSLDSIDCAVVQFLGSSLVLAHTYQHAIPVELRDTVHRLNQGESITLNALGQLDHQFGELFTASVISCLKQAKLTSKDIVAIGCHGQNIYHKPAKPYPFTMQIGDPNLIAKKTGIQTVADFRRADIALGGQGAPLAPMFHANYFHSKDENRIVLNLGGIANLTFIPTRTDLLVKGYDIGPANALMDLWAQKHLGQAFDKDGLWALGGQVNSNLLDAFLSDPYFHEKAPKSTGKELYNLSFIEHYVSKVQEQTKVLISPQDVQCTLLSLTAQSIATEIQKLMKNGRVLVCGGGIENKALLARLDEILNHTNQVYVIESTLAHGIDPKWVEAICFAWLAYQRVHLQPGNLPGVTGAKYPTVLGALYAI